jgi:phosphinothricin acetyltransferase
MQIRTANIEDLPAIVDIYNATIPDRLATADIEPVTVESRMAWFQHHEAHRRPLWVIHEEGEIVGWVSLNDFYGRPAYAGTAEISIYIHPNFRQQGRAQYGLEYALQACPSLNIHTLLAFVFAHNQPSVDFFAKNNFTEMGRLTDVARFDDQKISLLILGFHLTG